MEDRNETRVGPWLYTMYSAFVFQLNTDEGVGMTQ